MLMNKLIRRVVAVGSISGLVTLTSCTAPYGGYGYGPGIGGGPRATQGTVAGALIGAGAGGIIGNQSGRGLEGAAIGGVLGALAGSAIGQSRDQQRFHGGGWGQPQGAWGQPAPFGNQCAPAPVGWGHDPYGFRPGW